MYCVRVQLVCVQLVCACACVCMGVWVCVCMRAGDPKGERDRVVPCVCV